MQARKLGRTSLYKKYIGDEKQVGAKEVAKDDLVAVF